MNLKKLLFVLYIFSSLHSVAQNTKASDDLVQSGNKKDAAKNYSGAIDDFTAALKIDSDNVNAYYYRGYSYYELKKYSDAIRDFDHAIMLDSDDVETFFNRGNAKFAMEDYKGAIGDYAMA